MTSNGSIDQSHCSPHGRRKLHANGRRRAIYLLRHLRFTSRLHVCSQTQRLLSRPLFCLFQNLLIPQQPRNYRRQQFLIIIYFLLIFIARTIQGLLGHVYTRMPQPSALSTFQTRIGHNVTNLAFEKTIVTRRFGGMVSLNNLGAKA